MRTWQRLDIHPGKEEERIYAALRRRVVGHEDALRHVAHALALANVMDGQIRDRDKPAGIFFSFGTTGSGKTLLCEAVADAMLGSPKAFTKINCGNLQLEHEVAVLSGAPPGYVGHNSEPLLTQQKLDSYGYMSRHPDPLVRKYITNQTNLGQLEARLRSIEETERVFHNAAYGLQSRGLEQLQDARAERRVVEPQIKTATELRTKLLSMRPELEQVVIDGYDPARGYISFLQLDEFEKAHDNTRRALLNLFDKGELTVQSTNREIISFRNCFIFLTANLGQEEMHKTVSNQGVGFGTQFEADIEKRYAQIIDHIRTEGSELISKTFAPEFLGRVGTGNIFAFGPLTPRQHMECLKRILIPDYRRLLANKFPITLDVRKSALEYLVEKSFSEDNRIIGTRGLKNLFKKEITDVINALMAKKRSEGGLRLGDHVRVELDKNDTLSFKVKRISGAEKKAREQLKEIEKTSIDVEAMGMRPFTLLEK